jgi:hypothetical protein
MKGARWICFHSSAVKSVFVAVGIVCADIIALRKIEVESTDYALREYAATREQIEALERERRTKDAANSGGHENSLG